jgi:tetratricopeptide (TPR) repeat protein
MVYLWYADKDICGADMVETNMATRESYIRRAVDYGPRNAMAYAFYSEILLGPGNYERAEQMLSQALEYGTANGSDMFDVYRFRATCWNPTGKYRSAIDAYNRALALSPNMTFLQIRIGVNWRQIQEYDAALEMYQKPLESTISSDQRPLPYLAIATPIPRP